MKCVYEVLPGNSFCVGIYYTQAVQVTIGLRRFHPSVPSLHIISSSWELSAWSTSFPQWLCPYTGLPLKTKQKEVGEGRQKLQISQGSGSLYTAIMCRTCVSEEAQKCVAHVETSHWLELEEVTHSQNLWGWRIWIWSSKIAGATWLHYEKVSQK